MNRPTAATSAYSTTFQPPVSSSRRAASSTARAAASSSTKSPRRWFRPSWVISALHRRSCLAQLTPTWGEAGCPAALRCATVASAAFTAFTFAASAVPHSTIRLASATTWSTSASVWSFGSKPSSMVSRSVSASFTSSSPVASGGAAAAGVHVRQRPSATRKAARSRKTRSLAMMVMMSMI